MNKVVFSYYKKVYSSLEQYGALKEKQYSALKAIAKIGGI